MQNYHQNTKAMAFDNTKASKSVIFSSCNLKWWIYVNKLLVNIVPKDDFFFYK